MPLTSPTSVSNNISFGLSGFNARIQHRHGGGWTLTSPTIIGLNNALRRRNLWDTYTNGPLPPHRWQVGVGLDWAL
ncbi:hypothetical protein Bpfe_023569 [Biomphalaria pfeifferi]|uniref:Uncharacterized protein n=1 Tax=Biomphalaria pfeifferi TaxID=112525 RepID=A0AAD8F1J7_BIOPF|nr:hypothetical protein Bpfe_023569 [Biomphalaria pfeifferi]